MEEAIARAQDVGDAAGRVVHHHRELVAGHAVVPADHESPTSAATSWRKGPWRRSSTRVWPGLGRKRQAGGRIAARASAGPEAGAGPGVDRPIVARAVRRVDRPRDLRAGTEARVDPLLHPERLQRSIVEGRALALHHRLLVEVEAEPLHVRQERLHRSRTEPRPVQILDPEEEGAALGAGPEPAEQRRPGIAQVELAGRAGSEAAAMLGGAHQRVVC